MRGRLLTHLQFAFLMATVSGIAAADVSMHPVKETSRPSIIRPATNSPHVPPWSVGTPAPRNPTMVTPGGTFSRPTSTFSSQTGSFSRPSSTFAHPGTSYTPLQPIQVQPSDHWHRPNPHRGHRVIVHPHTVIIHQPVVYEPQYVPVGVVPVEQDAATPTTPAESAPAPTIS